MPKVNEKVQDNAEFENEDFAAMLEESYTRLKKMKLARVESSL